MIVTITSDVLQKDAAAQALVAHTKPRCTCKRTFDRVATSIGAITQRNE